MAPKSATGGDGPSNANRLVVSWALLLGACFYGYLQDTKLATPVGVVRVAFMKKQRLTLSIASRFEPPHVPSS